MLSVGTGVKKNDHFFLLGAERLCRESFCGFTARILPPWGKMTWPLMLIFMGFLSNVSLFWDFLNHSWLFFPQRELLDLSTVDVILISNYHCMMALPYITEHTGFTGTVYATEPTLQIGRYRHTRHGNILIVVPLKFTWVSNCIAHSRLFKFKFQELCGKIKQSNTGWSYIANVNISLINLKCLQMSEMLLFFLRLLMEELVNFMERVPKAQSATCWKNKEIQR